MTDIEDKLGEVIERAMRGDQVAVGTLYEIYERRLISIAHRRLGRNLHGLIESVDLVQSVWADVLRSLGQFEDTGPDSFFRWLHTCLLHKIHQKRRFHSAKKRDRSRSVAAIDDLDALHKPQSTPSEIAVNRESLDRLVAMIRTLPAPAPEVLLAHMRDELTFREIGERIGKSTEATKKIYQRGLARLIRELPAEWTPAASAANQITSPRTITPQPIGAPDTETLGSVD